MARQLDLVDLRNGHGPFVDQLFALIFFSSSKFYMREARVLRACVVLA